MNSSDKMCCIVFSVFFVSLLLAYLTSAIHEEQMAKAGLQQCQVANSVLWQKECK